MCRRNLSSLVSSAVLAAVCYASVTVAFQSPHLGCRRSIGTTSTLTSLHASLWQNNSDETSVSPSSVGTTVEHVSSAARAAATALTLGLLLMASPAGAVSGGGGDFASLDISGQDFSNKNYKGKDFTQVVAKGTTFAKSNLQGCRFFNSYLVNSNFEGADARGASFERNNMDGVSLKDANLSGAYFGDSLTGVETLENADFTEASIPPKILGVVCEREDAKGTNPTTGVDTRDSLMCP